VKVKTNAEATNVLGTFILEWERLGQLPPWKDPKVLAERQRIADLDLDRIAERMKHAYVLLSEQNNA
jgi:hypothetical protein